MIFERYKCVYCGDIANELDHVIPKSYANTQSYSKDKVIPCCKECNVNLGNVAYHTISGRASYLIPIYRKKYNKILKFPEWDEYDLEDMSKNMKKSIIFMQNKRELIKLRIKNLENVIILDPTISDVWDCI